MKRKILIGLCALFVILLIGGYIFLRSSFFTEKIRLTMEFMLEKQLGREASVGEVTGNIFGSISIAGVSIAKDKKLSDGKLIEVEEVTAGYSLLSLLRWRFVIKSVEVARPHIWLERDEEGELNLPKLAAVADEGKKSRFSVLVSDIHILSGEVTFDDKKDSVHSVVSGINGRLKGTGGQMDYSGKIRAQKVEIDVRGMSKTMFNLVSSFATSKEGVELSNLQLQLGRSHLRAKGEILAGESPQMSAEVRSRFFLEDVSEFAPQLDRLDGIADIYVVMNGKMPDLTGICRIDLPIVHVNDLKARKVNAEVEFTQRRVENGGLRAKSKEQEGQEALSSILHALSFDASADLTEGHTDIKGMVQFTDGEVSNYDGVLKLDHLDIGAIVDALNEAASPISGYLSGEVSVSGTELRAGCLTLDARCSILDTGSRVAEHEDSDRELLALGDPRSSIENPVLSEKGKTPSSRIEASLSVEGESIALDISRGKTSMELQGKFTDEGELDLSLAVDGFDTGEITSFLTGSPSVIGEGRITADASMKIADPGLRAVMGLRQRDKGIRGQAKNAGKDARAPMSEPYVPSSMLPGIADLRAQVNIDMPDLRLPAGTWKTQDIKRKAVGKQGSREAEESLNPEPVQIGSLTGTINLVDDRVRVDKMVLQLGESQCLFAAEVQNAGYWKNSFKSLKSFNDSNGFDDSNGSIKHPLIDSKLAINSLQVEDYVGLIYRARSQKSSLPISYGVVNGELRVHGEITDMSGSGEFSVSGLSLSDRDIDPISVPIGIESNILTIPDLVISSAGEQITTACSISPSGDYSLQVDSSLIDLSKLVSLSPIVAGRDARAPIPISGAAQISVSGSGNISSPSLKGRLELKRFGYNGSQDFTDGECTFALKDEKVHVDFSLLDKALIASLDGGVQHPFPFKGIVQLGNVNLEPALNLAGLGEKIDVHITGNIDVDGEGADLIRARHAIPLHADAMLRTVLLDIEGHRWANELPITFGVKDGKFWISQARMKGAGGQLSVNGTFDVAGAMEAVRQGSKGTGRQDEMDFNMAVEDVDLATISELLGLPKPVAGKLHSTLRVDGNITSPSIEMGLDVSNMSYEQVGADRISAQISYRKGIMEVEELVFNALDGEARVRVVLPVDLDLENLRSQEQKGNRDQSPGISGFPYSLIPIDYSLSSMPLYASLDAEDLNLSLIPLLAPQVLAASGEVDDVHLEMTGRITQPKISGSLKLKDAHFQLESLPVPIENLNGSLILDTRYEEVNRDQSTVNRGQATSDYRLETGQHPASSIEYEASLELGWKMEEGRYDARFSILDAGDWTLDAWHRVLGIEHPVSSTGQPDFQFDLEVQDGQLGSLVKEAAEDPLLPVEGNFSAKLHIDGSLSKGLQTLVIKEQKGQGTPTPVLHALSSIFHDLRGDVTVGSLDLMVNGYKVKNRGPIKASLADQALELSDFRLLTLAPNNQRPMTKDESSSFIVRPSSLQSQVGSVAALGRISIDESFELDISGKRLHPGLFSFLLESSEPVNGGLSFDVNAKGNLDFPIIALSFTAEDLSLPVASSDRETRIDKIVCKASYSDESLNVEEMHIASFGNELDLSGTLPIGLSLKQAAVRVPDREMDMKLVMHNFDVAFFSHLTDIIEEVSGNAEADISLTGSLKDPHLTGTFQLSNGACRLMVDSLRTKENARQEDVEREETSSLESRVLSLESINLDISMGDGQIDMNKMTFSIGGGQYEIHGDIEIRQGLEPRLFDISFKASPAKIDPFLPLVEYDLASLVSGEITLDGNIFGDALVLRGMPTLDILRTISGEMNISPEDVKIDAAGHRITNPSKIFVQLTKGKLDLPSLKLIDKTAEGEQSSSISAFGAWDIGGETSLDATVELDMSLVSELIGERELMGGLLVFKIQARGQEVECFWPPPGAHHKRNFTIKHAAIDRFEGGAVYREQEVHVEKVRISSGENHIILTGRVPMTEEQMALRLDARLDDMGILSFLNTDITESSGSGYASVNITGNMRKVMAKEEPIQFVGSCKFDDLDVNFDASNVKFENIRADIEINCRKLDTSNGFIALKALRGKMNDGEFVVDMDQAVQPGAELIWEEGIYKIGRLNDIPVMMMDCMLYQPMVFSILFDGDLTLKGWFDAPIVIGNVTISRGQYIESLESLAKGALLTREIGLKAFLNYPLVKDLELDVNVQVPGDMRMNNSLVDAEVEATATVRGPLVDPVVLARAHIVEGKFAYFGREFAIIKGEISNEARIDPEYDITAETEVTNMSQSSDAGGASGQPLKIEMELKGSLYEPLPPNFRILGGGVVQQGPDLSQSDIIAILTLGSTPEAFLSEAQSASSPLSSSVLMKPAKWYLESQAEKLLNLKEFRIRMDPNASRETRLVMAKQLMEQISVLVDVGYSGQQWIGLQYEMGKHFALASKLSQEGDWGLDLKVKRDFP